jgi:hypothetical protein
MHVNKYDDTSLGICLFADWDISKFVHKSIDLGLRRAEPAF